jgi:DNA-directed RNA polymerase specialized sigma24 family protein
MNDAPGTKRKRETNAEDFRRLLARLDSDPAQAWQAYDTLRQKLVMFFRYHFGLQAEELAEEVLDRIAKKSDSQEIANVAEFALGVARNLRKEAFRRALLIHPSDVATAEEGRHPQPDPEDVIISSIDAQRKLECLLKCMRRLDAEDRRLLFQYYPSERSDELEEQRLELARKHRLNMSALRTRMARLRDKMEKCFERCCAARKEQQVVAK